VFSEAAIQIQRSVLPQLARNRMDPDRVVRFYN